MGLRMTRYQLGLLSLTDHPLLVMPVPSLICRQLSVSLAQRFRVTLASLIRNCYSFSVPEGPAISRILSEGSAASASARNLGPPKPRPTDASGFVRDRYALLVGINGYVDPVIPSLRFCVNDVIALENELRKVGYTVISLHDQAIAPHHKPTQTNVLAELDLLCSKAGPDDLVLVHLSCHGILEDGQTLLAMQDSRRNLLQKTAIALRDIEAALRGSKAQRKVLLLDACHSGVEMGRDVSTSAREAIFRDAYDKAVGFALLAGSTAQQVAQEYKDKQHGVFSYWLLKGLGGAADVGNKGFVTVDDLNAFVTAGVRRWAAENSGLVQEPTARTEGIGSMILADYRTSADIPSVAGGTVVGAETRDEASDLAAQNPPLSPAILYCNRQEQWESIDQLTRQDRNSLIFVAGGEGQAHSYFMQRLRLLEGDGRATLRSVVWRDPAPPRSLSDYLSSIAQSIGCLECDTTSLAKGLVKLATARRLILIHPILYQRFDDPSLFDYYTKSWPQIFVDIGRLLSETPKHASASRLGSPFHGVMCIQPVEWIRGEGVRGWLARLLKSARFYPQNWVRQARTDVQAHHLMDRVRGRWQPPLLALRLKDLSPIQREHLERFCDLQGLGDPQKNEMIDKVLHRATDSQQVLDRLALEFPRYKAEYDAQVRSKD